ncbi:Uncharacterised protein [Bordetella pertussis]|nr:Uncharacterised protein [Bordetella pertussis]CFL91652.1 Uncharacterised protein [Bordetella pertussis]CFL98212.1 Uncharacterised protein [Bordetella pertussis]CFM11339.1 Uncharacterised protein [Bordetella pertussis]CFM27494.1 Uncharacterised protein [Bordetella pertussis]
MVVAKPAWSCVTLTVTGTPASGPGSSPAAMRASTRAAAASAAWGSLSTTALMRPLTASMRSSAARTASLAENAPDFTPATISQADSRHNSDVTPLPPRCFASRTDGYRSRKLAKSQSRPGAASINARV